MERNTYVVLGAGPAGLTIAEQLAAEGRTVVGVDRSHPERFGAGVTGVAADVTDTDRLRELTAGAAAVFNATHVAYPLQVEVLPVIQRSLLDALAGTDTPLMVISTLYAYGPSPEPITESRPFAPTAVKGKLHAEMYTRYLAAHRAGDVRVALGMAADYFGPRVLGSSLGAGVFPPALAGEPVLALGDIDLPHSYTYIGDVARGLIALADHPETHGRLWHLPTVPAPTTRQVHAELAALLGHPVEAHVLASPEQGVMFDETMVAEYTELFYQHVMPQEMVSTAITDALGLRPTPLTEALRTTLGWFSSPR